MENSSRGSFVINGDRIIDINHETDINVDDDDVRILNASGVSHSSNTSGQSHWLVSALIICNAALGAGLLDFPLSYEKAGGLLPGLTIQFILLIFIYAAMLILGYLADLCNAESYQNVLLGVTNRARWTSILSATLIVLYCFGTCITLIIIIGDQWDTFFKMILHGEAAAEHRAWYISRKFIVIVSSYLVILPMSFSKSINFLKYPSIIGVIGVLYVAFMICIKYVIGVHEANISPQSTTSLSPTFAVFAANLSSQLTSGGAAPPVEEKRRTGWTGYFFVIPVICFGYQCHVSAVPIYAAMRNRSLANFAKASAIAILACTVTYAAAGIAGYLAFAPHIQADILLNYPATPDLMVAAFLVAVKVYTSYPVVAFCGRLAVETLLSELPILGVREWVVRREFAIRVVTTLVWFHASLLLAVLNNNIDKVIGILGSLAAAFIFILPGLGLFFFCLNEKTMTQQQQQQQMQGEGRRGWDQQQLLEQENEHEQHADGDNNDDDIDDESKKKQRRRRQFGHWTLLIVSVLYIVLGVFMMGLSIVQSIMDLI